MKILIVAMTDSIHTARWVSQLSGLGWEIHIFPSILGGIVHPDLKNVIIHDDFLTFDGKVRLKKKSLVKLVLALPDMILSLGNKRKFHIRRLRRVIKRLRPDIVHSLEFQRAGYLILEALASRADRKLQWIATNWGSDIYYFSQLNKHKQKIKKILQECDFYSCECNRDICLAKEKGLKGTPLPAFPNSGGFDLKYASSERSKVKTSKRKNIALKGYQNWSGRALVALEALKECQSLLSDYHVTIYSPENSVEKRALELASQGVFKVKIIPRGTSHIKILQMHASSRISIGLSISDAISTSMLEAMVMGSFPIQSNTACADEWIEDGISGFIVEPEDVKALTKKIKRALSDDRMVDSAAKINFSTALKRLEQSIVRKKTIALYSEVFGKQRNAK